MRSLIDPPAPRFRRLLQLVAILVLVAGVPVGLLIWDGLTDENAPVDVGLILGNTVHPDGTPSARLAARLDRALELFKDGSVPLLIVSGAVGREGHDEATVMRDYLVGKGVPSERVIVDSDGRTTWASARNTHEIMHQRGITRLVVITQYFHVPRSKLAARRFGIATVTGAHAKHIEWRDLFSLAREVSAYLHYLIRPTNET
jgi:vancomycin permeability regulator SanA